MRHRLAILAIVAARSAASAVVESALDGTPDFLRLDNPGDRQAFRRWFTFLAEVQYFTPAAERPDEWSTGGGTHRRL